MKYTERVGDIEIIYEGEPKEIAELESYLNPKILTIKDSPLIDADITKKELYDKYLKDSKCLVNPTINISYSNPKETLKNKLCGVSI